MTDETSDEVILLRGPWPDHDAVERGLYASYDRIGEIADLLQLKTPLISQLIDASGRCAVRLVYVCGEYGWKISSMKWETTAPLALPCVLVLTDTRGHPIKLRVQLESAFPAR